MTIGPETRNQFYVSYTIGLSIESLAQALPPLVHDMPTSLVHDYRPSLLVLDQAHLSSA